jgi:hypothetical protein
MKIFELESNYPILQAELLVVPEFKKIWDRDKTKGKDKAKTELAYIYFMLDVKSAYLAYSEEKMEKKICQDLFGKDSYTPDQDLVKAMARFQEFAETPSTGLLKDARTSVNEVRKFLRTVDLSERNRMGMPVYKPKEVTSALTDLDKVVDNLQKLEERVSREDYEGGQNRGGTTGGPKEFDDD